MKGEWRIKKRFVGILSEVLTQSAACGIVGHTALFPDVTVLPMRRIKTRRSLKSECASTVTGRCELRAIKGRIFFSLRAEENGLFSWIFLVLSRNGRAYLWSGTKFSTMLYLFWSVVWIIPSDIAIKNRLLIYVQRECCPSGFISFRSEIAMLVDMHYCSGSGVLEVWAAHPLFILKCFKSALKLFKYFSFVFTSKGDVSLPLK